MPPSDAVPRARRVRRRGDGRGRRRGGDRGIGARRPPVAVGITNQRASTIVWDRATGEPIGPGSAGRTCARCSSASRPSRARPVAGPEPVDHQGRLAARQRRRGPATGPLLRHRRHLAGVDADRRRGARHRPHQRRRHRDSAAVADGLERRAPAALRHPGRLAAAHRRLERRRRRGDGLRRTHRSPPSSATSRRRSSGRAASPGQAKITFGSGGMLDLCTGDAHRRPRTSGPPTARTRSSPGRATAS